MVHWLKIMGRILRFPDPFELCTGRHKALPLMDLGVLDLTGACRSSDRWSTCA